MYKSERVTGGAPGGQLPAPFLADLGGGVKALAPTALFVNDKVGPPLPRSTRIGDVIIAWNIFQHFYPYFDVVRTIGPRPSPQPSSPPPRTRTKRISPSPCAALWPR